MLDKDTARAAWFQHFDTWQAGFNAMLKAITAGTSPSSAGTAFLRDVMTPWLDDAKDRLLRAIAKDVLAAGVKATRLDALVNKDNQ